MYSREDKARMQAEHDAMNSRCGLQDVDHLDFPPRRLCMYGIYGVPCALTYGHEGPHKF